MIWQPEFTDKTLSRKPGAVQVDAFVKKVISEPYEEYGKWWIDVEYISWGVPGKTRLMFESKEQALEVKEGYKFLT
ncbi:hypothetical protein H6H65_003955 [Salmonella enterica]|nr:hypothetical protein [Salmonella enterica]EGA9629164.1 hypothetical protein [Salmonella enterica]EGC3231541.1 hypothetical protein [Salmonella enterica]